MKKLNVLLMHIAHGRNERCEVGTWLVDCYVQMLRGLPVNLGNGLVDGFPTSTARNSAVLEAQAAGADVLVQVDDDMLPSLSFFAHAVEFLSHHPGAVCIGSPYCGAAPAHNVQVMRRDFSRFGRDEAAAKTGDELVGAIGTGLLACRLECFERVEPPWFEYEYADRYHATLIRTEDIHFTRRLTEAGGRVYCAWDHWSSHAKVEIVGKPEPADVPVNERG